ncbi:DNA primase small subunit, putative [Angomonas deanei]|uniref:DNA primase n=1 Tax=Angomonas deanei TaxID=59799 RepID=A0A7G2CEV6_9TRYP|nr:DNA primase small subunit, putative [Angomonas deanei]
MTNVNESTLREFYEHVYPIDLVVQWLSYNIGGGDTNEKKVSNKTCESYLARREFCFTMIGDIFTRFRSYGSAAELKSDLVKNFPEKIDVGAVYNIRPNQKQNVIDFQALERELVFDIDMSDYDNVRSCCKGKHICVHCWTWMSCAAMVLKTLLEEDFGFNYLLPVYSGRRGIHVWVCDRRARQMSNDERSALVGYLTVVTSKSSRSSVVKDLANHKPIHPSIRHALQDIVDPSFNALFISSSSDNPNNIAHSAAAASIVYETILTVLKEGRRDALQRFQEHVEYTPNAVLNWSVVLQNLGATESEMQDIVFAAEIILMFPRLDEHVSTRRDHLLKLPFCIHPGTGSLCCPLEWHELKSFDPSSHSPSLSSILLERDIDSKWKHPMVNLLQRMGEDDSELQA